MFMLNKTIKYRLWVSAGIILVLGICFLGTMFKTIAVTSDKLNEKSLLHLAKESYLDAAYKKAADLYEKILVLEPDSATATLDLAIIYDDYIGRKDRAIELYRRYLELKPDTEKKELVSEWIAKAAQASFGMQKIGKETYENKLSKLQEDMDELKQKKAKLEEEVEKLSGKLYNIQSEHQKEIQALQEQRERLSVLVTNARMRISSIAKALKKAEEAKKEMQNELEEAVKFQKTTRRQ